MNKILMPILGFVLIIIEIILMTHSEIIFYNDINFQLFITFIVAGLWANKNNSLFKIDTMYNFIFVILFAIQTMFSSVVIIAVYIWLILMYYILKKSIQFQEEITFKIFELLIFMYIILKVLLVVCNIIIYQHLPNITGENIWYWLLEVLINTLLTLFFHKILNKNYKLLYN